MQRARLRTLLILFSLAAVVSAAGLVGGTGTVLLRRMADEEARARVALGAEEAVAADTAAEEIDAVAADTETETGRISSTRDLRFFI